MRLPMPPMPYRVVNSGLVTEEFRALIAQATAEHRLEEVKKATKKVFEGLKWVPDAIGESTEELSSPGTIKRHVLEEPLTIDFAINEEHRVVFILHVHLWPMKTGKPPDTQENAD
jgi:hypothetical protein